MANISSYFSLNRMALALAIGSFTPVAAFPAPYYKQAGVFDIATGIRIGKLLEKAKKNFEKGKLKDLIENMLDIKAETEIVSGNRIDLDNAIDHVLNDVRMQGVRVDLKTQNAVKRIIKDKGKRYDYKSYYMAQCLENGIEYDATEEETLYLQMASKGNPEDNEIPLKLVVGVTAALCGMFIVLVPLPIPAKGTTGTFLITTGLKYAADAVIEAEEQRRKK